MSLINNLKDKITNGFNGNSQEDSSLEDTIIGAIINNFKDIESNIELGYEFINANYTPVKLNFSPEENYKTLNLMTYVPVLTTLSKVIDKLDERLMPTREHLSELSKDARDTNATLINAQKALKYRKLNYSIGDSLDDFLRKNAKNRNYILMSNENKESATNIVVSIKELIENNLSEYKQIKNSFSQVESTIKNAKNSAIELAKNLSLIRQIQEDETNSSIPANEIDSIIVDLLYSTINRTRALKEINKIKEAKKTIEIYKQKSKEPILNESKNNISQPVEQSTFSPDLAIFQNYGINGNIAKSFKEDKNKYETAKYFISHLETILNDAGLDNKQLSTILQKNPELLFGSKKEVKEYLNTIEKLYELINPIKVSGILPSNNSEIYKSSETLRKIISNEQSKDKKINIINPELITDEKDRKTFENRMNCAKTGDERIQKYLSRKAGKKTILYDKYSSEFGEGTYMKGKLGKDGRRVIYKIEPTETIINVMIINYFTNHDDHVDFFKPK